MFWIKLKGSLLEGHEEPMPRASPGGSLLEDSLRLRDAGLCSVQPFN